MGQTIRQYIFFHPSLSRWFQGLMLINCFSVTTSGLRLPTLAFNKSTFFFSSQNTMDFSVSLFQKCYWNLKKVWYFYGEVLFQGWSRWKNTYPLIRKFWHLSKSLVCLGSLSSVRLSISKYPQVTLSRPEPPVLRCKGVPGVTCMFHFSSHFVYSLLCSHCYPETITLSENESRYRRSAEYLQWNCRFMILSCPPHFLLGLWIIVSSCESVEREQI